MKTWKKMPSNWVNEKTLLPQLQWKGPGKSNYIAALMIYIVFIHEVCVDESDGKIGQCRLTYEDIHTATGLSRPKISKGLALLKEWKHVEQIGHARNGLFEVADIEKVYKKDASGWAKCPANGLYKNASKKNQSAINAFKQFNLRSKIELHALKLYLVILTRKDNISGKTIIGYDKINEYTSIATNDISAASSLLVTTGLIRVSTESGTANDFARKNVYTPTHLGERHSNNA